MPLRLWRFITITLAAFSLSLNMTHLLELPPRLRFDQRLWVDVTVFHNVYHLFGSVGAVFEVGAILAAGVMAFLMRKRGVVFFLALGGALCLALSFAGWLPFVAPANAEFAKWLTIPVPPDWTRWRNQWEYAHAANALIKITGLGLLVLSVIAEIPKEPTR